MSSALDITYKTLRAKGKSPIVEGSVAASLLGADAYIGLGTRKLSWLNSVRYKTTAYLLGSMETKGEYKPNYLDYQTYLSYQPNKRWKIDFIGNISDNHYNFEPSDRETTFGTMENVKNFRVYFDGQEKDRFLTYFGTLGITRNITSNTSISLLGSAFYTREQENTISRDSIGSTRPRPQKPRCRNLLRTCPQLSHGSCDECQADAET